MKAQIEKITLPEIELTKVFIADAETENSTAEGVYKSSKPSNRYGKIFPIVQINGRIFEHNEVLKMELDCTSEIPKVSVVLQCFDGYFMHNKAPRDGSIITIFISSNDNLFTPIKNDFLITHFASNDHQTNDDGAYSVIRVSGILNIPQWHGEVNKSINGGSFDALKAISRDLKLGFASNVKSTQDKMNWICPYDTYERWVNDISSASYNGENSFFVTFIDQYYFLNFIDMNIPYSEELTLEDGLLMTFENRAIDMDANSGKAIGKVMLTDLDFYGNTNFFIKKYSIINNSGRSASIDGYQRILQFFDLDTNQKYEIPVEPLTTIGNDDFDTFTGDKLKDIKKKYIWLGMIDTDNMHDNYMWAQVHNFQNKKHISKMELKVELAYCNFNLYRGLRVPVLLTVKNDPALVNNQRGPNDAHDQKVVSDKYLSGYYVITGIKFISEALSGKFTQELTLSRREWPKLKTQ